MTDALVQGTRRTAKGQFPVVEILSVFFSLVNADLMLHFPPVTPYPWVANALNHRIIMGIAREPASS